MQKDPYGVLELTSELTNRGLDTLEKKQLIALTDENMNTVRTIWVNNAACNFEITSTTFITSNQDIRDEVPIPPALLGKTL